MNTRDIIAFLAFLSTIFGKHLRTRPTNMIPNVNPIPNPNPNPVHCNEIIEVPFLPLKRVLRVESVIATVNVIEYNNGKYIELEDLREVTILERNIHEE